MKGMFILTSSLTSQLLSASNRQEPRPPFLTLLQTPCKDSGYYVNSPPPRFPPHLSLEPPPITSVLTWPWLQVPSHDSSQCRLGPALLVFFRTPKVIVGKPTPPLLPHWHWEKILGPLLRAPHLARHVRLQSTAKRGSSGLLRYPPTADGGSSARNPRGRIKACCPQRRRRRKGGGGAGRRGRMWGECFSVCLHLCPLLCARTVNK